MPSTPLRFARLPLAVALTVLMLATTLVGVPAVDAQSGPPQSVAIDLEGTWRFQTGDDDAWSAPDFDDSAWEEVMVPTEGGQDVFDNYDGFAWFRLSFDLPAEIQGENLVASLGFIDDADIAFLNGVEIGRTGVMPPESDSQWFERRQYPVPAEAPIFGGSNVLAVRINDFTGGGGWYRGPVGLFSKAALREAVYGITGPLAPQDVTDSVRELLDAQASALAAGDADAYLATLDPAYVHQGRNVDRRAREIRGWLEESGQLTLSDAEVEVINADDGRLIVDTNRTVTGTRDGESFAFQPTGQEFLVIDPDRGLEAGDRSRFFRDQVESAAEGKRREYVVYLPPSYYADSDHQFPTVYLLHGINGGSREWEPRDFQQRLDELFTTGGLAETIVVMPDGESLWYIDSSVTPWRTMFIDEMLPQVEREYRTLTEREFRGLSGVSMGGHGAFTVGWSNPELFGSIASHMGALSLPPLVGGADEVTANTPETPLVQVGGHTPDFLSSFTYYFDACADDDFRFAEAVEAMDGELSSKMVPHTAVVFPEGRHNDDCWLPHIGSSFGLHSDRFREAGLEEPDPVIEPIPAPGVEVQRIAGSGRVETAVAMSAQGFSEAEHAVLATAADFPDALAAGPMAIAVDGPLLLSHPEGLSPAVATELERLGVARVDVVGGEAALSAAVVADLQAMGLTVTRVDGEDRLSTAVAVARRIAEVGGPLTGAVLARADSFVDALAASAVTAGGGVAILLTDSESLSQATRDAMNQDLPDGATVVLAGGTSAVSSDVEQQVRDDGFVADRRGGEDRYSTAAALRGDDGDLDPLVVASGAAFPDALTAGVLAARLGGGLLLVDPLDLANSPASAGALDGLTPASVLLAGGPAAISDQVRDQIQQALTG